LALDEFFASYGESRPIFDALRDVVEAIGPVELHVSKSQIAFRHRVAFAWAWIPGRYLRGHHAPLVLSVSLPYRHESPRWKEVVEPSPGRFMHHLELQLPADVDEEVCSWLTEAWAGAG
jgi:hypothetical protein